MPITTLYFDAVGTLIHLRESPGIVYARFASQANLALDPKALDSAFRQTWRTQPAPDYSGDADFAARERTDRMSWQTIVKKTFTTAQPSSERAIDAFVNSSNFDRLYDYFRKPSAWHIDPTAAKLLKTLQHDYNLYILSNFDSRLEQIIAHLGLRDYFVDLFYSTRLGACKPAPAIFERAVQLAHTTSAGSLHVGDDYERDILGAQAAGLHAFHVTPESGGLRALPKKLCELID